MSYYIAICCSRFFCLLPQWAAELIGKLLGSLFCLVVHKRRKLLDKNNIMRCLNVDEETAQLIAKKSVTRFGIMAVEVMRFPVMKKHIDDYIIFIGKEHIESAHKLGRGGVAITSHSGNWELLGAAFANLGVPTVAVGMKQKSSGADKFITEYRELMGMHSTYKSNVREMFEMLKDGWFIVLLSDQDIDKRDGIVLTFFNRPTNCATGAATLARFNEAPIVPLFLHRREDGRHEVIVHEPVFVEKTKNKREDIKRTTQELTAIMEAHIRKYPEEWFWLHDRWKSIREEWKLE